HVVQPGRQLVGDLHGDGERAGGLAGAGVDEDEVVPGQGRRVGQLRLDLQGEEGVGAVLVDDDRGAGEPVAVEVGGEVAVVPGGPDRLAVALAPVVQFL